MPKEIKRNFKSTAHYILCGIVLILGVSVLVGWWLDIEIIKRIVPIFVAMNPMTAIAFILAAWATLSLLDDKNINAVRIVAFVVFLVGALKIFEIATGFIIGIDTLLFRSELQGGFDQLPNRMAPNTALNFALIGVAIFYRTCKSKVSSHFSELLLTVSVILSTMALVGYGLNIVNLYSVASYIPMAVHTAVSFLLLSFVLLTSQPSYFLYRTFSSNGPIQHYILSMSLKHKLLLGFSTLLLLLLLLAGFSYFSISNIQNTLIPLRVSIRETRVSILRMEKSAGLLLGIEINDTGNSPFYQDNTSLSIDNWENNYKAALKRIDHINEYNKTTKAIGPFASKILPHLEEYRTAFYKIVQLYQKRGFVDYGLEGEMRSYILDLEERLGNSSALVELLKVRRIEKDYFMRNNPAYISVHEDAVSDLRSAVSSNAINLNLVNEYQRVFNEIVEIEREIGLNYEEGLLEDMSSALVQIEPLQNQAEDKILSLTDDTIIRLKRVSVILSVVFALLGAILAYLFGNLVVNSLNTIKFAASDIARGNFRKRINLGTNDELSQLGDAFNSMASQLDESYKSLEQSRAKDEAILAGIGDGVFALDSKGRIILFNESASLMSGYAAEEVIGKTYDKVLKFISEDDGKLKDDFIKKAFSGKRATMANHTALIRKDGSKVSVADSAAPFVDGKNVLQGIVVVFRDVTKENEIDRAKDEFTSLASHQLRTPLTAIRLYSEMMLSQNEGKLNKKQKEYMDILHESTLRMIKLVGDILNVSRIQLGSLKIVPQPVDLSILITDILNEIELPAKEKGVSVVFKKPKIKINKLELDASLIRQVIHNLVTNAVRYSPVKSTVEVSIQNTNLDQTPKGYLIKVVDQGIGIPKEAQAKIFTRFFRAENAVRKEGEGTGLGMYMAKMVMDIVRGKIWFESEENKGTTFCVIIPQTGMARKDGTKTLN